MKLCTKAIKQIRFIKRSYDNDHNLHVSCIVVLARGSKGHL